MAMPPDNLMDQSVEQQLRRACAELDRRLRTGESCRAEEYLASYPQLATDAESALELIYTEFVTREQLGEPSPAAEFFARFPQWRESLGRLIEVHELVGDTQPSLAAATNTPFPFDSNGGPVDGVARGRRLGQYELLEEIDHGGMGVVFAARQLGLDRIVAIKMLRAGDFAGPHELARFRTEAEAAARLQHPNIVQIFEVGQHDGRPFLSLEFVDGGSLDKKLAGKPLPARDAAGLLETLARAMHYAHERGVVHRDLKPSNVLLQKNSEGPKISDFGLAKRLTAAVSGHTQAGAILGTPSYMAPEQAGGRTEQVGPAADVYALGAILYEALTGRPPFQAATLLDTLEQVRTQEPVPPTRLQSKLPRDLETICLKCLEKDPRRRYASADALADDLRRFLADEPILARAVGPVERTWRWCHRKPLVAGLVAALVLVFLGGFAGVFWQWRRAEGQTLLTQRQRDAVAAQQGIAQHERDTAIHEQERAEANFQKARSVVDKLTSVGEGLVGQPGMEKTGRAVLEEALRFYEGFLQEKSADPAVRLETARACVRVGTIRRSLGQFEDAEHAMRQGADHYARLAAEFPAEPLYRTEQSDCVRRLASIYVLRGEIEKAREAFYQAIAIQEQLLAESPDNLDFKANLANTLANLATVMDLDSKPDHPISLIHRSIELRRDVLARFPDDAGHRSELALCLNDLSSWLWRKGERAESERLCREAFEIWRKIYADAPDADSRQYLARGYSHLAELLAATSRPRAAFLNLQQALRLNEQLAADWDAPDKPDFSSLAARAPQERSGRQIDRSALKSAKLPPMPMLVPRNLAERRTEAEKAYRHAIQLEDGLSTEFPNELQHAAAAQGGRISLGLLLAEMDRHREAIVLYRRLLDVTPDQPTVQNNLAWMLANCPDESLRDPTQAVVLAERAVATRPQNADCWNTLGVARYRSSDWDGAVAALETATRFRSSDDPNDLYFLAAAHWQLGHPELARGYFARAVEAVQNRPASAELDRFRAEAIALLGEGD